MKEGGHKLPDGRVAPFPRARFEKFLSVQKIQSRDAGLVPFTMLGSQRYLLDEIEAAVNAGVTTFVILKARGGGISTILLLLDIFWCSEYPGTLGSFVTHEEAARDQFRAQIDVTQMLMPKGFQVEQKKNSRLLLIWENTSLLRYLIAGTKQTTNKLGRSGHSNLVHGTEVAFWGSPDDMKALMQAVSELHPHRLYYFESTANGFNHYEEMWRIAKGSPAQRAIFIGWWRDERNEFDADHPLYTAYMSNGTRTPLSPLERRRCRAVRELYDFDITAGQIAWYRYTLENKCEGDQATMDQENPWTETDAFVSTGAEFFSNDALTEQNRDAKGRPCYPFAFRLTQRWDEIGLYRAKDALHADLKIWEMPADPAWAQYVLGHDPSFGTGRDDGSISVMRCYADACIQVAEYSANSHSPTQQAWVLAYLCGLYKSTMPIIELTGPGLTVFDELKRCQEYARDMPVDGQNDLANCLAHMRHFLYRRPDALGGSLAMHWKSNPDLKDRLMSGFRGAIETGRCRIRSLSCLEQMRRIVEDENVVEASTGKDDKVIASALAYHAYDTWCRMGLKTKGMTVAESDTVEKRGGLDPVEGLVRRYLSRAKIVLRPDQVVT